MDGEFGLTVEGRFDAIDRRSGAAGRRSNAVVVRLDDHDDARERLPANVDRAAEAAIAAPETTGQPLGALTSPSRR